MDITSLQSQNTIAINKAMAFVKSEGIANKDIQTQYYDVSPRYQTDNCNNITVPQANNESSSGSIGTAISMPAIQSCPPASIVGYTITQTIDVKIRDFTKIGSIMSGVVANGANQVGQLSFTLDDPSTTQNQAEADAITKDKAEAQIIATAGDFKIGKLLNIEIGGTPYPVYSQNAEIGAMAAPSTATSPAPTIQPGSEEVDTSVTLQYEIR